jgi:mRNA-degrading endonuclease toxin of MazEF toxin-antitoxin module
VPLLIFIPCTTNRKALRFPFTSLIEPTAQNGLSETSVALVFHMRALDVSYFSTKLGVLEKETLAALRKQAHQLIGE